YILSKPGKLTDLEYEIIKKHTTIGGRILKDIDIMPQLSDVAMSHHERYDGKGYPHGKKGEEISLFSRIVCIADSVDAMISERSYKPSMPLQSALKEVEAQSGLQFDPSLVKVTKSIFAKGVPHEAPLDDLNLGTSFLDEIIKVYTSSQKGTDLL
ncbi:MAG: HD domain-containing phosphohydrolase, partial [Oscillospiraceae bacterium]